MGKLASEFLQYCYLNNLEKVRDCLARGVDVNTVSEDGDWSGLNIAAYKNYLKLLDVLLSQPDIKINKATYLGWTALMFACHAGNSEVVSKLVQVPGVDLNHLDEDHEHDAESLARLKSHTECLNILRKTNDENQQFIQHCQNNNLEEVAECLARGVDVNARSVEVEGDDCWPGRWSGLTVAAYKNYPELLEILLSHPHIKINQPTNAFEDSIGTALMVACHRGNAHIVSRLLQIPGLDTNYQADYGYTAAHIAIHAYGEQEMRSPECLEILAKNDKVDWNKKDNSGQSPLESALEEYFTTTRGILYDHNIVEIVEILLQCPRVDLNLVNPRLLTGLLFECCDEDNTALLSRLVQVPGLDLNFCEKYGNTAAINACKEGNTECIRILAESGRVDWNMTRPEAFVCLRGFGGFTPLYWALLGGFSDIVDIIVKQPNIDFNVQTDNGETLASAAVMGKEVKFLQSLAALESFDSWDVPNEYGDTPIMDAVKDGNLEIVEILLRCPRVDLDVVDADEKYLEENTDLKLMKDLLWTSTTVRQRMILSDSLLTRQAGSLPSLQSCSRDAVLLIISANNRQERLVRPLVERLGQNLTRQAREILLASYSLRTEEKL